MNRNLVIGQDAWRRGIPTMPSSLSWMQRIIYTRRLAFGLVFILLMAWLLYRLLAPFWAPVSHFVILGSSNFGTLQTPRLQIDVPDETDLASLGQVAQLHVPEEYSNVFAAPGAVRELSERLAASGIRRSDILILYVAAPGITLHGTPYLLCRNFDFDRPAEGACEISTLLAEVSQVECQTKLIILDAGSVAPDARLGRTVDDFPQALAEAVKRTGDERLLVLASHSQYERSHSSSALAGSVFGTFVYHTLTGAIGERTGSALDTAELAELVQSHVGAWVDQASDGRFRQTPQLLSAAGAAPARLLITYRRRAPLLREARELVALSKSEIGSAVYDSMPPSPRGVLSRLLGVSRGGGSPAGDGIAPQGARGGGLLGTGVAQKALKAGGIPTRLPDKAKAAVVPPSTQKLTAGTGVASPLGTAAAPSAAAGAAAEGELSGEAERTVRERLAQLWELRQRLAGITDDDAVRRRRPSDEVPHQWRELTAELLEFEQRLREGRQLAQLGSLVDDTLAQLEETLTRERSGEATGADTGRAAEWNPPSLAMARLLGTADQATLDQASTALDKFLKQPPEKLAEWPDWQATFGGYLELHLIKQLSTVPGLATELVRLAVEVRRQSEEVAAVPGWCIGWISHKVEEADSARLAGERQIINRIQEDWAELAEQNLNRARSLYREAENMVQEIQSARELRNELVFQAPYLVQWYRSAQGSSQQRTAPAAFAILREFLGRLREFTDLLDQGRGENYQQVTQLRMDLLHAYKGMADEFSDASIDRLVHEIPQQGNAWRIQQLLDTPLVSASSRRELSGVVGRVDLQLARSFDLSSSIQPPDLASPTRWWLRQCELELALADLASVDAAAVFDVEEALAGRDAATGEAAAPAERLNGAVDKLGLIWRADAVSDEPVALQGLRQADPTGSRRFERDFVDDSQAAYARLRHAFHRLQKADADPAHFESLSEFGEALAAFYKGLNERVAQAVQVDLLWDYTDARRQVIRGRRALEMLDPRDAWRFSSVKVSSLLSSVGLYDMLVWQRRRLLLARAGATTNEESLLSGSAALYAAQAARVFRTMPTQGSGPRLVIDAPVFLSLTNRDRELAVTLRHNGVNDADMWLVLQYDPAVIEVVPRDPVDVYHEHSLRAGQPGGTVRDRESTAARMLSGSAGTSVPLAPGAVDVSPQSDHLTAAYQHLTFGAKLFANRATIANWKSGQPAEIRLQVHSLANRQAESRLIVHAFAKPASRPSPHSPTDLTEAVSARREIELALPILSLVVAPPNGPGQMLGTNSVVHPFPNRLSTYRLGVVNSGPDTKEVSAKLYRLPRPWVPASEEEAIAELAGLTEIGSFTISALADGEPHYPLAEDDEKSEGNGAAADPKAPAAGSANGTEEEEAKPPQGVLLEHGLLVELVEAGNERARVIRPIAIRPQRPRRYVRPRVGYNAAKERIEVNVVPQTMSLLPPGDVSVVCELADSLEGGTKGRLKDFIRAPDYEANLFIDVPSVPSRTIKVYLHVDDYPRAFVYEVPCGGHSIDLPEEKNLMDVRVDRLDPALTQVRPLAGVKHPEKAIPIRAEVDVPVGSFESQSDSLLLGIDADRDGRPDPESTLRLSSDRDSACYCSALKAVFSLDTRVTDIVAQLPSDRLDNLAIDVLRSVQIAGTNRSFPPVEVRIDAAPPTIMAVNLLPSGRSVAAGSEFEARAWVWDAISGVQTVEAAFDPKNSGVFPEKPAFTAFRHSDREWILKLTADQPPGSHTLLVRAIDQVGNQSPPFDVQVTMIDPEVAIAQQAAQRFRLEGIVTYRRQPVVGAVVNLQAEGDGKVPDATTDEQGRYVFSEIPKGSYALTARGVMLNLVRLAKLKADVGAEPVQELDVELK